MVYKLLIEKGIQKDSIKKHGYKKLKSGTELFVIKDPEKPDKWFHALYGPLSDEEIQEFELSTNSTFPLIYKEFLKEYNGIQIFENNIMIYGRNILRKGMTREEQIFQPLDLKLEQKYLKGLPEEFFYFGQSNEKFIYVISRKNEHILEIDLKKNQFTKQWNSMLEWLKQKIKEFAEYEDLEQREICSRKKNGEKLMFSQQLENLLNVIEHLTKRDLEFSIEDDVIEIHLFKRNEFKGGQLGYRFDEEGNNLITDDSDWKESWYVIGYEELLGDPIIVDIQDSNFPIFTIEHDGEWIPQSLANSFGTFLKQAK